MFISFYFTFGDTVFKENSFENKNKKKAQIILLYMQLNEYFKREL